MTSLTILLLCGFLGCFIGTTATLAWLMPVIARKRATERLAADLDRRLSIRKRRRLSPDSFVRDKDGRFARRETV